MPPNPKEKVEPKADPSRAYEHFLSERKEILDYKWIESQRVGEDIGLERALTEWVAKHRAAWKASQLPQA